MKNLYLTDKQYYKILLKIRATVNNPKFNPYYYNSTMIGDKYTESNCGFCNDVYTELDTALFPKDFKKFGRKSMKYRKKNHKCPFDLRLGIDEGFMGYDFGCFYHCFIFGNGDEFKSLGRNKNDIEFIKKLVEETIEDYENHKK